MKKKNKIGFKSIIILLIVIIGSGCFGYVCFEMGLDWIKLNTESTFIKAVLTIFYILGVSTIMALNIIVYMISLTNTEFEIHNNEKEKKGDV